MPNIYTNHRCLPPLQSLLQQLIATPSVSSSLPHLDLSNVQVIDLLAEWFAELGFAVEKYPIPAKPGKFNLIATMGTGTDGLVLAGHTDTVPCDADLWASDPFVLTERDDKLYGLGIADMKSFFALVIEALRELDLSHLHHRPLTILATADEESSMMGAKALLTSGRHFGRHLLLGEPTNLLPVRMHKGILMESLCITGKSGHSSDPSLGNNALEGMYLALGELLRWRAELRDQYRNVAFHVPVPTINLGRIQGGDSPNRICGHCELHFDFRPLPGMDINVIQSQLQHRITTALADTGLEFSIRHLFEGIPALETPANAPIVRVVEALTGHTAGAVAYGTEAPYFANMGMQTVILGPGGIEQAHQPNEFLAMDRITPYITILRKLVHNFVRLDVQVFR